MKYSIFITLLLIPFFTYSEDDTSKAPVEQSVATQIEQDHSTFYLGGLLGSATTKEQFERVFTIEGKEYRQESDSLAFGIYAGFNFANIWSLETSIMISSGLEERPSSIAIDEVYLTAITITPVLHFDITDKISIYVKAGLGFLIYVEDYKKHSEYNHDDGDYWAGIGFAVGAGLEFKTAKRIHFRLGFDYITADMDADEENHHINLDDIEEEYSLVSMSMHYNF